jgi:peptide deformylase
LSESETRAFRLIDLIPKDDPIVKYGDPILREKAKQVTEFNDELPELIQRMEQIMRDAKGVGLAAPQVGISKRIFIYDSEEGVKAIVNPKITRSKGEQTGEEGCLSLPGLQGEVTRALNIVLKAQDINGKPLRLKAEEFEARVMQHEIDHLDGILFIDEGRADPDTLHWLTAEELAEEEADGTLEKIQE